MAGVVRWHDERDGPPDDWVTTIARSGSKRYVGTFVGGLADWAGKRWHTTSGSAGENVTAVEPAACGDILVATRHGVRRLAVGGLARRFIGGTLAPDPEAQCLCRVGVGIWIGTRSGLFFVKRSGN